MRVPIAYVVGTTFSRGWGWRSGPSSQDKPQHLFDYSALCRRADVDPNQYRASGMQRVITSCLRVGFESHEARAIRRTSSMMDAA